MWRAVGAVVAGYGVYGLEVRVGQGSFPLWLSAAGFVGAGFLSAWGFVLGCKRT